MGIIKGIKLNLDTSSDWWSPTADKLFLGVYSKKGGREFRLNKGVTFGQPSSEYEFGLGTPCCTDGVDIPLVEHSTGFGVNDPRLNPIDIKEVGFVYLRKETDDSTTINDDWLVLDSATVLLCDDEGNLRQFAKRRNINFSDEGGLQHWLGEIPPPRCRFKLIIDKVTHTSIGRNRAGNVWRFDFGADANGVSLVGMDNAYFKKKQDYWEWFVSAEDEHFFVGCCGQQIKVTVKGKACEQDLFNDDCGEAHKHHTVTCTYEGVVVDDYLEFEVQGDNKNRKSRIRMDYRIVAVCA